MITKYVWPKLSDAADAKSMMASRAGWAYAWSHLPANWMFKEPQQTARRRLLCRVWLRSWGNATPAQGLLAMAYAYEQDLCLPTSLEPLAQPIVPITPTEMMAHWDKESSTKEYNAAIRIANDTAYVGATDRMHAVMSWLCTAPQTQIQPAIKPIVERDFTRHGDWWDLVDKDINGLKRMLKHNELFPPIKKGPKPEIEDLISTLVGDKKGFEWG